MLQMKWVGLVALLIAGICFAGDAKDPAAGANVIDQKQGTLGTTSQQVDFDFTTKHKGFRASYKIEGQGPYRLTIQKQEHDAVGTIIWKQVDILIANGRGNKTGGQSYKTAPAGIYRLQIIGQNASYHLIVDDPWTTPPTTKPAGK